MSVAQQLAELEDVNAIDIALVEGVKAADLARELQDERGLFQDVRTDTLARELSRRHQRRLEAAWPPCTEPPSVAGQLEKSSGPLAELKNVEALAQVQLVRVDRALAIEHRSGRIGRQAGQEIERAAKLLSESVRLKVLLGVDLATDEPHIVNDFKGLSRATSEVLQRPESRHKVLSLVDRLAKRGKLKFNLEEVVGANAEP